jgi:hypothetical protein
VGFVASPAWGDRARDFRVTARVTDVHKDDNGRNGPSPGDRLTFHADLFQGNRVGMGDGVCVITDDPAPANDFISKCGVTFELPDGNLRMEGKVAGRDFGNGEFTIPVVGGTGDFRDAAGEAHFAQVDDSSGSGSGYRPGYSYGYDSRSGYYPYADTNYSAQSADSDPAKANEKDGDKRGDKGKGGDKGGDKRKGGDKGGDKRKGGDESAHKEWGNRDHHEGDNHNHHEGDNHNGDRHDGNGDGHREGDHDRHEGDRSYDRDYRSCWDCYNRCWDCHRGCWDCYNYYDYYDGGYHSCYDYGYSCGSYYNGHDRDYRNYPVFDVAIHLR